MRSERGNPLAYSEAFDGKGRVSDPANAQTVTRVNAEQASKQARCAGRPDDLTQGRLTRLDEDERSSARQSLRRGSGDGMRTQRTSATQHGKPHGVVEGRPTGRSVTDQDRAPWGGGEARSTAEAG
ncbi:MAG: hypothetical protein MZV63_40120 [Marinilabiliales bacterium]|nr:hypothetical protein [Marinilabiliales bacterium]